ncbi:LEA domain protein [Paecilomyces variotii No. 5]|uniref:LEA domain protein n=1 Tax=Byssochlamys spectabilis (strain No. 5 / NBRC 109023) TaxID=1356009 RepID=V5G309_BYSSN|nr:LEA domain protein [Paecilomyces variotii No. 5]
MSFITRVAPLSARVSANTTAPVLSVARSRFLSSTASNQKGPVETTKETLKKVDRTISDAAVKGLEKGEKVSSKAKETVGVSGSKAKGEAAELTGEAKGKAQELTGEAKGKAEELAGEAKGKAKEASSKLS